MSSVLNLVAAKDRREYRVLVCGSRSWTDWQPVWATLDGVASRCQQEGWRLTLIEGGARGADELAAQWANELRPFAPGMAVEHERYPAQWDRYGLAAGPRRNQQMLDTKPDLVIAFSEHPLTRGTADMVNRARQANVDVWIVSHGGTA